MIRQLIRARPLVWAWVLVTAFLPLSGPLSAHEIQAGAKPGTWSQTPFADGRSVFSFDGWEGAAIPVYSYVPTGVDKTTAPIMVMMHGAKRGAKRYLEEWIPYAQREGFIVIAPLFAKDNFPTSRQYNLGWIREKGAVQMHPEEMWSFSAIEPLFDAARATLGSKRESYTLYGHSAGSQFIHRFLFLKPDARVSRFLPANAGWYTFPDIDRDYPYGLGGIGVNEQQLRAALAKDVVILLGDQDIDTDHESLRRTKQAMRQGNHRFARGVNFFRAGRDLAKEKGWDFGWTVRVIKGVAHQNGGIARWSNDLVE